MVRQGQARTVVLDIANRPEERVARIKLATRFGDTADHKEYPPKPLTDVAAAVQDKVDKANDLWFDAQWVVSLPDAAKAEAAPPEPGTEAEKPAS